MRILYTICQLTWGILQTLGGLYLFIKHRKCEHFVYRGAIATRWHQNGGISLGLFIFVPDEAHARGEVFEFICAHEYGHTLQSLMLGPLYLFVIGICSYTWAYAKRYVNFRKKYNVPYCWLFTEAWANRLGGKTDPRERE